MRVGAVVVWVMGVLACGARSELGAPIEAGPCDPPLDGILAANQLQPHGIAVDSKFAYWINLDTPPPPQSETHGTHAELVKCSLCGCNREPTVLASGLAFDFHEGASLTSLVVRDERAYFNALVGTAPALASCSVGGCSAPTPVDDVPSGIGALAVDASNAYWITTQGLVEASLDGSQTSVLGPADPSSSIAVDATSVYWLDGGSIVRCAIGGCNGQPTTITAAGNQFTIDDVNVYWLDPFLPMLKKCSKTDCTSPTTIATGFLVGNGRAIASDGARVYWAGYDTVFACPVEGCDNEPTVIAGGQLFVTGLTIDANNVYWVTAASADGQVRVAHKP